MGKRQVIEIDVTFDSNYDELTTTAILKLLAEKRVKHLKITNTNKRKDGVQSGNRGGSS